MRSDQDNKTVQDIASKIRQIRLKRNMKQVDVAEKAGLNGNYYARVERGEAIPSAVTLKKIVLALKAKSSDVLDY